ncbi:MAG: hypothetical protein KBT44_02995, partial [Bacteroidales bacterium]|nr:hypothetical protein [Candidatus Equibacterium intestinale]
MKKTILAGMALAALLLSSCAKDFTADIEELQNDVKDLKTKVESIQSSIAGGAVVTSVDKTDNGIVIKMSDNKQYEITSGKDGKNGENGAPGSVVTINDAGNWAIDGVDQGISAHAENGDYYKPCTDSKSANFGKWIKVDGTTGAETVTDMEWKTSAEGGSAGSGLTAVWEDDVLMLFGVQGYEDEDYFEISFTSELRGFAVYPTNWSATWGLPYVTSYYMINPNIAIAVMTGNLSNPRLKDFNWQGGIEQFGYPRSNYSGFGRWLFGIAYATYLGALGMTDDPDYNECFDANSAAFNWQWTKDELHLADPGDILDGVKILCEYMHECFDNVENHAYLDFVPTTPIDITYRVIPMGASLANYKFSILEHGINITKVGGENRDNAVTISGKTRFNKKDELTLTANTSFFKAMGYTPLEFIRKYNQYNRYGDDGADFTTINNYVNSVAGKYLDAMGLTQALMINLEASTNGRGSEAIVSDGCIVKFEPFEAYIYFKNDEFNYIPLAFTGAPTDTESAEPVAKLADSYDLGSKLALRDPVIGNATKYGFDVQWAYSIPAEFGEAASVSAEGVITRSASAVSGTIVPVTVSAHVMTPA